MNEIYVLITGCYSDWYIEGFVESEEEAVKTCIAYNKAKKKNMGDDYSDYWDEMYYKRVNSFNEIAPEKLEKIHPNYEYCVKAWKNDNSWIFPDEEHIMVTVTKKEYKHISFPDKGNVVIIFTSPILDRKKALKISQDMLYQKLAEREGL